MTEIQLLEPTLKNLFTYLTSEAQERFPALRLDEERQRLFLDCPPVRAPLPRRKNEPVPSRVPLLLRTEMKRFFEDQCGCDATFQRQNDSLRYQWNSKVYALDLAFEGDTLVISLQLVA